METAERPASWKILLAFAIIYFVWGSTYLAIRVGVREVPPFLLAGMRFLVSGVVLYGWMRLNGTPAPTPRQWAGATVLGTTMFLVDYGCLFWAEQRVPSGIAAIVLATIPVFITLLEIIFLRTQRLTLRLALALLLGLCGVAVLTLTFIFIRRASHQSRRSNRFIGRLVHLVCGNNPHSLASTARFETYQRRRPNDDRRNSVARSSRSLG